MRFVQDENRTAGRTEGRCHGNESGRAPPVSRFQRGLEPVTLGGTTGIRKEAQQGGDGSRPRKAATRSRATDGRRDREGHLKYASF